MPNFIYLYISFIFNGFRRFIDGYYAITPPFSHFVLSIFVQDGAFFGLTVKTQHRVEILTTPSLRHFTIHGVLQTAVLPWITNRLSHGHSDP